MTQNSTRYWMSLDQASDPAAYAEANKAEFTSSPIREGFEKEGLDRRDFLKWMGASAAMASFAGCTQRPVQTIVPYVTNPEEIIPGIPNFYASACPTTGYGLLVKTREGRPIKVDGNSDHPMNGNGLSARGQAGIHDLYDPDRLRAPRISGKEQSWTDFDSAVSAKLSAAKGGVYLLTASVLSPSLKALIKRLDINHTMVDALSADDLLEAQEQSYGTRVLPRYRFDKADYILSFGADFLGTWISPAEFQKQFSSKRKLTGAKSSMSKLVVVESAMSLTGQNADERISVYASQQALVAAAIAGEVAKQLGKSAPELASYSLAQAAEASGVELEKLQAIVKGLLQNKGESLVVAGSAGAQTGQALSLQLIANYLNSILGNEGNSVDGTLSPSNQFQGSYAAAKKLIAAMNAGQVKVLMIQGINPLYSLPDSLGFAAALAKVPTVIYATQYLDETAAKAEFLAAESHSFEAWGDVEGQKDLFSICQPTIQPLWKTKSLLGMLLGWSGSLGGKIEASDYEFIQKNWQDLAKRAGAGNFTKFWEDCLQLGVLDLKKSARNGSASPRSLRGNSLSGLNIKAQAANSLEGGSAYQLLFMPSIPMGDGAQANNAILQEMPDPVSKVSWGNFVGMAPATAAKLGLNDGDVVELTANGAKVALPVLRQPGLRANALVTQLGYGRKLMGRVGDGVGARVLALASVSADGINSHVAEVSLAKTGRKDPVACSQGNHSLEGRDIVFETTLGEFQKNPKAGVVHHLETLGSLWSGHEYKGYKWGMAIDTNSCTGCSACVVACSVENNVPNVGKEQVLKGRIMHWIRIDRYYAGSAENPETITQPMLCQHCDNAPCETVCPVIATVHSDEGLNQMIYNRCVGTKYCSNNCPYKVRRFNWFNNNGDINSKAEHPIPLSRNPEVTLRSRGVMEKCTFCVQRIETAKHSARLAGSRVGEELRTACQDACPSDAIVFGDLNNPDSRVAKLAKNPRGYQSLEELNARPAITYLTKVRNRSEKSPTNNGHHG